MSKYAHTPGPWIVDPDHPQDISPEDDLRLGVASICNSDSINGRWVFGDQSKANASLIAAAPDLLEALEMVIADMAPAYHDCTDDGLQECAWCTGRKAISRAKGESQ